MKKAFTFLPAFRTEKQDSQPGNPTSALTRRREQLRKAQHTHRQRKNGYYKSLESEVLRLRASEVTLTHQVQDLRNHIEVLQGTVESLTQHSSDISHDRTMMCKSNNHSAHLDHSHMPSPTHLSNQSLDFGGLYNRSPNSHDQEIEHSNIQETVLFSDPTTAFPSSRPSYDRKWSQDMTAAGMEFILALEHPCLPHLGLHSDRPNGHSLLASSTLLHPNNQQSKVQTHGNSPPLRDNPAPIFARLLALSEELVFEDELSPTQAWCYILQQPWAHRLERGKLKDLTISLMKVSKCYGFGAVMRRDTFKDILVDIVLDIM